MRAPGAPSAYPAARRGPEQPRVRQDVVEVLHLGPTRLG